MIDVLARRRAGVLLHATSLPGRGSTGTLGANAYRFVDFLCAGGFTVWQTLPLGPVDAHGSPYCLQSTQAGDTRLIDWNGLRRLPDVPRTFARGGAAGSRAEVYREFAAVASRRERAAFVTFVRANRAWLWPYGLFRVFEARFGGEPWWLWPAEYRHRERRALARGWSQVKDAFRGTLLLQYLFDLEWAALKRYANSRGVYLFGDLPFYVDMNSVEVWWNRRLFRVSADGVPDGVAGVPPDYFSADGQRWGNPLFDWDAMRAQRFAWWVSRIAGQFRRFNVLRIDHFRALESYWEIPTTAPNARAGRWRKGSGEELLARVHEVLGELPLVAEDLGIITDEVRALRDRHGLPGMAVLQFAFDGTPDNPHLPQNHARRSVVYTGTHDNDTLVGWYAKLAPAAREVVRTSLGVESVAVPNTMLDALYASRAELAVVPMQDLLGLDSSARMNTPGTTNDDNWRWRLRWADVPSGLAQQCYDRAAANARLVT
jgi:4-alpha-glucanotransferase